MDPKRKFWNEKHKALKQALSRRNNHQRAIGFFLDAHAMVHSAKMAKTKHHLFEDDIWEGLSNNAARRIPAKHNHSIAWVFWHLARIEDVTMNLLVAGKPQVFIWGGWQKKLNVSYRDTGNNITDEYISKLSTSIDLKALRTYRIAVGRCTQQLVGKLTADELRQHAEPDRLQQIWAEQAVRPSGTGVVEYWGKRTFAGLLLMPPTRHNFFHLNECQKIKRLVLQ